MQCTRNGHISNVTSVASKCPRTWNGYWSIMLYAVKPGVLLTGTLCNMFCSTVFQWRIAASGRMRCDDERLMIVFQ